MPVVMRLLSVYVMLTGVAVAVHFVAVPWYHPGGAEPYPVWEVLNWLMGAAIFIALAALFAAKRRFAGDGAGLREYLAVNVLFYATLVIGLLFYWNWSNSLRSSPDMDWLIWNFLDVAIPLALVGAGARMWRVSAGS